MEKTKEEKLQEFKNSMVKSSEISDQFRINEEDKEEF